MRFFFCSICCFLAAHLSAQDIVGFWTTINDTTKKPQSIVAIYEYMGMHYGRIIGAYDRTGVIFDTMYEPVERATGIEGNPYYSGLDFIYNLKPKSSRYEGRIVDPKQGNVYRAELWTKDNNLVVRGKLFIFGRNQTWLPFSLDQFTEKFPKPDVSKFVPNIPVTIK